MENFTDSSGYRRLGDKKKNFLILQASTMEIMNLEMVINEEYNISAGSKVRKENWILSDHCQNYSMLWHWKGYKLLVFMCGNYYQFGKGNTITCMCTALSLSL